MKIRNGFVSNSSSSSFVFSFPKEIKTEGDIENFLIKSDFYNIDHIKELLFGSLERLEISDIESLLKNDYSWEAFDAAEKIFDRTKQYDEYIEYYQKWKKDRAKPEVLKLLSEMDFENRFLYEIELSDGGGSGLQSPNLYSVITELINLEYRYMRRFSHH